MDAHQERRGGLEPDLDHNLLPEDLRELRVREGERPEAEVGRGVGDAAQDVLDRVDRLRRRGQRAGRMQLDTCPALSEPPLYPQNLFRNPPYMHWISCRQISQRRACVRTCVRADRRAGGSAGPRLVHHLLLEVERLVAVPCARAAPLRDPTGVGGSTDAGGTTTERAPASAQGGALASCAASGSQMGGEVVDSHRVRRRR